MRLASPVVPMWRELLAMRYLWQRPHRLDEAALTALIGALPRTTLQAAISAALADAGALERDAHPSRVRVQGVGGTEPRSSSAR